jgi:cation diffusion facilitator CzcD-associated flavoprotein CzcO
MPLKRVAVIGTGPSGAIAVDALVQEGAFDVIRVFERQEKAGGNWYVVSLLAHTTRRVYLLTSCAGYLGKQNGQNRWTSTI